VSQISPRTKQEIINNKEKLFLDLVAGLADRDWIFGEEAGSFVFRESKQGKEIVFTLRPESLSIVQKIAHTNGLELTLFCGSCSGDISYAIRNLYKFVFTKAENEMALFLFGGSDASRN
jgi:hypothetical protein